MKRKVSVIIPTFNERGNMLRLIPVLRKISQKMSEFEMEVVVVDDDSPDKTGYVLKESFEENSFLRVFIRKAERGLGSAIKFGILKSKGEIIVGMDADFNHDPDILPRLLEKVTPKKLVIASRFIKGGGTADRFRFLGTWFLNFFLRTLGFPSTDNASGYYAAEKRAIINLGLSRIYYGYGDYHLRLVYLAGVKGYKISEVPVFYKPRRYGQSKSNLLKMFVSYVFEAFRLKLKYGRHKK